MEKLNTDSKSDIFTESKEYHDWFENLNDAQKGVLEAYRKGELGKGVRAVVTALRVFGIVSSPSRLRIPHK